MSDENIAVSRRFGDAIASGNVQALQADLAPNFVGHFPGAPGPLDVEGVKQLITVFASAFPGSHFEIVDEFAAGDKVVIRWTYHATHRGDFQGLPPTGKPIMMTGITILCMTGGKVVEYAVELDQLGLLRQLGAIPAPSGQAG
jgi:predicted ester cyclase